MNPEVSSTPITAAHVLASMASAPSVGPTVRCSITPTGTGSAPPSIRVASRWASFSPKPPVIRVFPPVMPRPQETDGSICGEEMTFSSSTIATRRCGSPGGEQAALPVRPAHFFLPSSRKSIATDQPEPCWVSSVASAVSTCSPVIAVRPGSGCPVPLGGAPLTGWKESCAVRPRTSAASFGSWSPGSSTMMRVSPERTSVGSETPSASTRWRSTSIASSVVSDVAFAVAESRASRTICVPPRRSMPRRGCCVMARIAARAVRASATTARTFAARVMVFLLHRTHRASARRPRC